MTVRNPKTLAPWPAGSTPQGPLLELSAERQKRLDDLMARNNNRSLTGSELDELRALVREAEAVALANARALADHRLPDRQGN